MLKFRQALVVWVVIMVCSASVQADVTHVVLCWFRADAPAEVLSEAIAKGQALAKIPGVLELRTGTALASERDIVDDSFQIGLTMRFADQSTMQAYLAHPDHVDYVASYIKPWAKRIQAYDIID
jgi:hypothetical protein